MAVKVALSMTEIAARLKATPLPEVDRVVGIGTGGTVPAALVAYELGCPLSMLTINYRDPSNQPRHPQPVLVQPLSPSAESERILLVDDVAVSGQTLALASDLLADHEVTTLTFKGSAEIVLFPEIGECVQWPWREVAP